MAKYTMELRDIIKDIDIFNFDYPFYAPELKVSWQQKFINYYYYYEINSETLDRWQHMLKTKLIMLYPIYYKLYETELKSKDIEFLLNKDLSETWTRELIEDNKNTNNQVSTNKQTNITNENMSDNTDNKVSDLANGLAYTGLENGDYTRVENNNVKSTSITNNDSNNEGTIENTNLTNNKLNEGTKLISKGNIGTTSSAQLLRDWRDILQDLEFKLIQECRDLFMLIY